MQSPCGPKTAQTNLDRILTNDLKNLLSVLTLMHPWCAITIQGNFHNVKEDDLSECPRKENEQLEAKVSLKTPCDTQVALDWP